MGIIIRDNKNLVIIRDGKILSMRVVPVSTEK